MDSEAELKQKYIRKLEHLLITSVKNNIKFRNNVKNKLKNLKK